MVLFMSSHTAVLIAVMSGITILIRFLPFLIFSKDRKMPNVVLYLGRILPGAVLGMLVIYCLKDLSFQAPSSILSQLTASAVVVLMQIRKQNTILSILIGTIFYILILTVL